MAKKIKAKDKAKKKNKATLARLKFRLDRLVGEILDLIPQDAIIHGIVLDPAVAGGQFVKEIERRKRAAGKSDEEIRQTVFGIEDNVLRRNYAVSKNDLKGTYTVEDAMAKDFQGMRFDVIVGNPPFQETDDDGNRKSLSSNLWSKFIDRCANELLEEDGYMGMISPASWAGPTKNLSGDRHIMRDILAKKDTTHINISDDLNLHFGSVGSIFSYFVLRNQPYGGKTTVTLGRDITAEIDLRDHNCLPRIKHPLSFGINQKYFSKVGGNVIDGQLMGSKRGIRYSEFKDETFSHRVYHTAAKGGRYWYTNIPHPRLNAHKVMISISGIYKPVLDRGEIGYSNMCLAYIVKDGETVESAFSVINSRLFHWVTKANKWSGFNNKEVIRRFALPKLDHVYDDEEIFDHFGLTPEEREFVCQTVKTTSDATDG